MAQDIIALIKGIRSAFLDHHHPNSHRLPLTTSRVTFLLSKISETTQSSETILETILAGATSKFRSYLMALLKSGSSEASFMEEYDREVKKVHLPFRISYHQLPKMMKQIYQSGKSLLDELKKITLDFETFQVEQQSFPHDGRSASDFQVGCLLRMVLERGETDLQAKDDDLLFRVNMLWESIDILLHKSQYVLEQIAQQKDCENVHSSSSSIISNATKKSALSESIQVFKQNQLKQIKKGEEQNCDKKKKSYNMSNNIIFSDYKMSCRRNKEITTEKRGWCCFGK